MSKFLNWYKQDEPAGAFSNKQIFWFVLISFTAVIIKIMQQ
jgi:hypothetical protein